MRKWILAVVVVTVVSVGLWAFEPWRLWTSSRVVEAVPGGVAQDLSVRDVVAAVPPVDESSAPPADDPTTAPVTPRTTPAPPRLTVLSEGEFEDAEHGTTGTAYVIETADGERFLRFEGLATSDGPDLFVGLSDAPSGGSWGSYDDSRYLQLGELKATQGDQNYPVPDDVDLDGLTTAVVWCDRFNVAFGTAPLG